MLLGSTIYRSTVDSFYRNHDVNALAPQIYTTKKYSSRSLFIHIVVSISCGNSVHEQLIYDGTPCLCVSKGRSKLDHSVVVWHLRYRTYNSSIIEIPNDSL